MKTWPKYHKKHCWLVRKIVAFRLYRKIKKSRKRKMDACMEEARNWEGRL